MARQRRRSVTISDPIASDSEGKALSAAIVPQTGDSIVPVIVDAGSRSKASIRRLKNGKGSLMREVAGLVHEARSSSTPPKNGILPIVIVYRQKGRRRNRLRIPLPFDLFR